MAAKKISSVTIIGRRWRDKANGNTYHAATIIVNGEEVGQVPRTYGYGNAYEESALSWLDANGYVTRARSANGRESLSRAAARMKFKLVSEVADVARKKDL